MKLLCDCVRLAAYDISGYAQQNCECLLLHADGTV